MAVVSKDELLKQLKEHIGESTDDNTLAFIENVTDTMNDFEVKTKDSTEWKKKYEDNDAEWRKKYTERFFQPSNNGDGGLPPNPKTDGEDKPLTFESLFDRKE